ncbi:hypothetical protein [Streptomyces misionensis]|uniref:hypothetical protein n=1 Tax=Streptomyces misionensis TaxID=67331 RepID=UPI00396C2703
MGDSFSSGEGASEGNRDYYPETNWRNKASGARDACHRSTYAWSRQAKFPGEQLSIGELDDNWSARMGYHLIACSGSRTYNVIALAGPKDRTYDNSGELPQINQGYLEKHRPGHHLHRRQRLPVRLRDHPVHGAREFMPGEEFRQRRRQGRT